jgi:hypothetical protein
VALLLDHRADRADDAMARRQAKLLTHPVGVRLRVEAPQINARSHDRRPPRRHDAPVAHRDLPLALAGADEQIGDAAGEALELQW